MTHQSWLFLNLLVRLDIFFVMILAKVVLKILGSISERVYVYKK